METFARCVCLCSVLPPLSGDCESCTKQSVKQPVVLAPFRAHTHLCLCVLAFACTCACVVARPCQLRHSASTATHRRARVRTCFCASIDVCQRFEL
eukprot:2544124-Pleurochrysis_carterae.AAC.1